jgi:uncharacterized protein (UPF0332 family)
MTSDQTALITKAVDSVRAAELLAGDGYYGFAVSRAYYAMFYVAEAMLLELGLRFTSHAGVISAFGQRFSKTQRVPSEFHHYLLAAQDGRTEGDYDIHPRLTADDAALAIGRAHEFIKLGQRTLGESAVPA